MLPAAARCRTRPGPAPARRPARSASTSAAWSTIGPRDVFTRIGRGLHQPELPRADEPARALAEFEVHGEHVGLAEQRVLLDPLDPDRGSVLGLRRFWLQATHRMPNTRPNSATRRPILPRPRIPSVLPFTSVPSPTCQPPAATEAACRAMPRVTPSTRPQASAGVASGSPPAVPQTGMPRAAAGRDVDGGVPHPHRHHELQPGQGGDEVGAGAGSARGSAPARRRARAGPPGRRWCGRGTPPSRRPARLPQSARPRASAPDSRRGRRCAGGRRIVGHGGTGSVRFRRRGSAPIRTPNAPGRPAGSPERETELTPGPVEFPKPFRSLSPVPPRRRKRADKSLVRGGAFPYLLPLPNFARACGRVSVGGVRTRGR